MISSRKFGTVSRPDRSAVFEMGKTKDIAAVLRSLREKTILTPTNEAVYTINDNLLEKFLGEETVYLSCDNIDKTKRDAAIDQSIFSREFMNGLKFLRVPNHRLALKVGVPIMLLRDLINANEIELKAKRLKVFVCDEDGNISKTTTHVVYIEVLQGSIGYDTSYILGDLLGDFKDVDEESLGTKTASASHGGTCSKRSRVAEVQNLFEMDYALWEVIENGNSWVPIPVTATETGPSTGLKMTVPSTTEEKICKKNDVKARSLLLMALPNEHQLTFDHTNNINTLNPEVSTATTKVNTASTEICTASFSGATVYAFLSTQPKGSQLVHEDLEQLHDDDLEEMDLKWNMTLLSMRARKFNQRTGRKIIIDGSNTAGYDKLKVECFYCH
ncbi:ribonuclease H-like domain-containing protein [Tanacetum coccineum]